jgi:alpha-beta hydrolase superfamily lysophospholipase
MRLPGRGCLPPSFRFTSTDGVRVACVRWDARAPVRGIVQIGHGMGERIGRYVGLMDAPVGAGTALPPPRPTSEISGEDPVGQQLEGVKVLIGRYQKTGISCISHDFYLGGRHEMLNEINRDEVRTRLLGWISSVLEQKPIDPAAR